MFILDCFERDKIKMFYYQTGSWVRINLVLGMNHLSFGYESSGYETSDKQPYGYETSFGTKLLDTIRH